MLTTLADLPSIVPAKFAGRPVLQRCREGRKEAVSADAYVSRIRAISVGLAGLGIQPGDRVAIVAESRPEWQLADLGVLTAGAVTVPVYPTLAAEQVRYVLADSDARAVFVSTVQQAQKVAAGRAQLPSLQHVILIDASGAPAGASSDFITFDALIERGSDPAHDAAWRARAAAVQPSDLATIIYTSGTTGDAKGVMLTHRNMVSNVLGASEVLQMRSDDVAMSFLPLSHAFERMVVYMYLCNGVTVAFAEAIETLGRDILAVRPTIMTGVPRVYEKLQARIVETVQKGGGLRQRLFEWGLAVGRRYIAATDRGGSASLWLQTQRAVAERLVYGAVRARLGGRLRCLVSGSAPLGRATAEFFMAIGLPLLEGYGLTETSPVLTVNPPGGIRLGTVGPALKDVEVRIADDGEILARGPNVMTGYYRRPDATAAVLENGWFHTGDIGVLDADGYLTITDRKKDLIVTSGGKKIAPQPIEARLRTNPLVNEVVLIGDRRKFISVLIVPDFRLLQERLRAAGRPAGSHEELIERGDVKALFQPTVDEVNASLAQFERIKKFALLPTEFKVETGELTPTLKVKRKVVEQRWKATIDDLYEGGAEH